MLITIINILQKTLGFINLSEETSSGKKPQLFAIFPSQQHSPTEYFNKAKYFSKQKLKSSCR